MKNKLQEWIIETDIIKMQEALEAGLITSEDIVQVYLERIHKYDIDINSILEINPEVIQIARALDKERAEKGSRGSLHGIPIVLKDNIDTADKMHTSAGSVALAGSIAAKDSFVAAKLRLAGAILLGKANMSEWSNFMSSTMPAGYSSRGGLVLNPYGPGTVFVSGSSPACGSRSSESGSSSDRNGNRRIYCRSSQPTCSCRNQTYGGISQPFWSHSHFSKPGYPWAYS